MINLLRQTQQTILYPSDTRDLVKSFLVAIGKRQAFTKTKRLFARMISILEKDRFDTKAFI